MDLVLFSYKSANTTQAADDTSLCHVFHCKVIKLTYLPHVNAMKSKESPYVFGWGSAAVLQIRFVITSTDDASCHRSAEIS